MPRKRFGIGFARRGGGAWTPASLTNLAAWYTAGPTWCFSDDAGTTPSTDGGVVALWKDRSGNAINLAQTVDANRPTLRLVSGKYVVRFDGSNDRLVSPADTFKDADPSVFGVWANLTQNGILWEESLAGATGWQVYTNGTLLRLLIVGTSSSGTAVTGSAAYKVIGYSQSGTTGTPWVNRTADATVSATLSYPAGSNLSVGNRSSGVVPQGGDVGEFVMTKTTAISAGQRTQIWDYFTAQWGTP